jgi:hypothetical protein
VIGVGVAIGIALAVVVGVGVAVAVTVVVGVGVAVGVVVGVGVADAVAGSGVDGIAVGVGDVLGADVFGARVAGEVTCPEFAPVAWGVQPATAMPPAASRPTSDAMASGLASRRRSDRPLCVPAWTGAGSEVGASLADVTVLVALPVSACSTNIEATGPDG